MGSYLSALSGRAPTPPGSYYQFIMKAAVSVVAAVYFVALAVPQAFAQYQYPFQNPDLPLEQRVDNIISLMTLDEKIACLGTNPSVPRLGIRGTGHSEGLHGLALGGPGGWGRPAPARAGLRSVQSHECR